MSGDEDDNYTFNYELMHPVSFRNRKSRSANPRPAKEPKKSYGVFSEEPEEALPQSQKPIKQRKAKSSLSIRQKIAKRAKARKRRLL